MSVNPDSYKALRPEGHIYGQSDGLFLDESDDSIVLMHRDDVVAGWPASLWVEHLEDFLGKALNVTDSVWAVHDTSAAGTPIAAILGDSDNGAFRMAFDSTSEAQVIGLYWNDELNIDSDQKPVFICRLQIQDLLDANDTLTFGLTSARNSTADSVANHAWFRIESGGALLLESDDGTTDNDDKDPSVTLAVDTYYEFKIDCASPTDVKFYYRATLGGAWTALTVAGVTFSIGADIALQPNFQLQKSTGAQETGVLIDYVRLRWKRN